jgi:hypothetical protein
MAKNSDQRAGGFEEENTGGVLSGLLAEEEHLDRRAMFRLATWGVVSVGAVVVAVLANQSGMKSRHDEVAALDLTRQSQQIQSVAKEGQNETRRLASAIDTLNSDRDRMYSRLTSLEQGLESVTGAIAKQNAAAPPPAASSPAATPAAAPVAAPQPVAQSTAPEPAPVIAPVMTVAAAAPTTEKSASERWRGESKKSTQAPVAAATPAASNAPPATSAMPLMASRSMIGPPDPAAGKLIEPKLIEPETPAKPVAAATPTPATPAPATAATTTPAPATSAAAAPAATPTSAQATTPEPAPKVAAVAPAADKPADRKDGPDAAPTAAPQLAVKRTEFGVDIGGANSVGGLRALWRGMLKWRANAALAALQPIIVVKESNNGLGMQLRLVAGPLTDAAAAAKICASMTVNDRHCETTVYDGQRLALKAEDTPTTTESISAKPSAENSAKPPAEKPSDPAAENSASDKSSAKPGNRQSTHRRYSYSKRSAPVVETPPPPAQTSSLSWFRLRSQ